MPDAVPTQLFAGHDSISRGRMKTALTGVPEYSPARSNVSIKVCNSQSEVAHALEIDASLSASYLSLASMSAKMKFMKKLELTERSVAIVVRARHGLGTWTATEVTARDKANVPKNEVDGATFFDEYGDSYVDSVTLGAEFYGVYIFRTETRTEQEQLTAHIETKVTGGSVSVSGDTQTKLTDFLKTSSTSYKLEHETGGFAQSPQVNEENLIGFALGFNSLKPDAPVVIDYTLKGYETVGGFKRGMLKIARARRYFMGNEEEEGALAKLQRLKSLSNQVAALKRIYLAYGYTGDKKLGEFGDLVDKDRKALRDQVDEWVVDPTVVFETPPLPSLTKGEPVLAFIEPEPITFGGKEGGPVDFGPARDALRRRQRISAIRMWGRSDRVTQIELTYKDERGEAGKTEVSFGSKLGQASVLLNIDDGDFPHEFIYIAGSFVEFLAILLARNHGTPQQRGIHAGSGTSKEGRWTAPEGYVVIGIGGRAGHYVDQVRVFHVAIQPATFSPD